MPRHSLFLSCLFSVLLLLAGPVASAWAVDWPADLAPTQSIELQDSVDDCAKTPSAGATSMLDDLPAGDPPFAFRTALPLVPHLQQVMNAARSPFAATAPPAAQHKPPSV